MNKKIRSFLALCLLILSLIVTIPLVNAQEAATPNNKIDGVPVVLDGEKLFVVYRGVGSFSATDRVQAITKRIEAIAQDFSISVEDLKIEDRPNDDLIYLSLGDRVILTVTPQDSQAYRLPQEKLAEDTLKVIKSAIEQYRAERRPDALLRSVIYTVIASLFLLLFSFFIIKTSSKIFPVIRRWIEGIVPNFRIQDFEVISARQISLLSLRVLQFFRLIIFLFIFYIYLTYVFGLFPWTKTISERIFGYLFGAIELVLKSIVSYLPNIFVIAVIVFITYYILRFVKSLFAAIERGRISIPGFYSDWAQPTYNLVRFFIIALAAVVAFPYLPGFDSPAFRGISVFLGILFSLGSTTALSNIVGGIILIYTRAFQIGDRIQVGDITGDVIDKTLLVTRIRTIKNMIVTIPNSSLLNSNVINFSASSRESNIHLIIHTTITLGYDLPWRKVHQTLIEAALATQHVLEDPAPFVFQTSLDDFYISYQLNAYIKRPNLMTNIYSELHQNIQDKCNEVGIEIMSPHYSALRDGNQTTIPENYLPSDYAPPGFRIQSGGSQNL